MAKIKGIIPPNVKMDYISFMFGVEVDSFYIARMNETHVQGEFRHEGYLCTLCLDWAKTEVRVRWLQLMLGMEP